MNKEKTGFTLIELLVVVLIIGILTAIAVPQYTRAVNRSRLAERLAMTRALIDAQQRYFLENGSYATSADGLDIIIPPDFTVCTSTSTVTYYKNSKTEIVVGSTVVGMGNIGTGPPCENTNDIAVGGIVAYPPGSPIDCPTGNKWCLVCFGDDTCKGLGTKNASPFSHYNIF